jgi:glycerol uptake facilitator-like aquaporin
LAKPSYSSRTSHALVAVSSLANSLQRSAALCHWGCARLRSEAVPVAVGLHITGAYWFTASTSFANPAVTLARVFTNTFAGIRPIDAPGFIVVELLGAFASTILCRWLVPSLSSKAKEVVFSRVQ